MINTPPWIPHSLYFFRSSLIASISSVILGVTILTSNALAKEPLLEEVLVTATKREQAITDIPITMNVVSGQQLKDHQIFQFQDIQKLSPGLELNQASPRTWSIALRGAPYDPDSSAASTVVTYWNEVPVLPDVAFQQMFDIQRIEVLRGAQGTLQGETSPSGAVLIHTRKGDVQTKSGYIRATGGNSGSVSEFAAGMPLIEDRLALRIAGVLNNDDLESKSVISGENGSARTKAGRISFNALPTQALEILLTHEYLENDSDGLTTVQGVSNQPNGNPPVDGFDRESIQFGRTSTFRRHELTNLTLGYDFGNHTLTLVNGYQENILNALSDLDPGNIFASQELPQTVATDYAIRTHELRFSNNEDAFWEYIIGAYYNISDTSTDVVQTEVGSFTNPPNMSASANTFTLTVDVPVLNETSAIFMNNNFHLSEALTATFGLRHQWQRQFTDTVIRADQNFPDGFGGTLPPGTVISRFDDQFKNNRDEATTGEVKLSYDIAPEWMIYGGYARSFRPGGSTIQTDAGIGPDLVLYDNESSNNIELGFKHASDDGLYQLSGALYYQNFKGFIQRDNNTAVDRLDGVGNPGRDGVLESTLGGININADAVIRGLELEGTAYLSPAWKVFTSLSYNDAKYDSADVPCGSVGEQADADKQIKTCTSDGRLGGAPLINATVGSEYNFSELLPGADIFVRGLYRHTGKRSDDFNAQADALYKDYGVLDVYTGIRANDGQWEVSLWATNLTDEEAYLSAGREITRSGFSLTTFGFETLESGYIGVSTIPGRAFGITGTWSFGEIK